MAQLKKANYVQSSRTGSHHTYALTVEGERIAAGLVATLHDNGNICAVSTSANDHAPAMSAKPPPAKSSVANTITTGNSNISSKSSSHMSYASLCSTVIDLTDHDVEEELPLFERIRLRQQELHSQHVETKVSARTAKLVPAAIAATSIATETAITTTVSDIPHTKIARVSSYMSSHSSASLLSTSQAPLPPPPQALQRVPSVSQSNTDVDWSQFSVVMLLDNRELGREVSDRQYLLSHLQARDVNVEVRDLSLGDVMWIAKHRSSGAEYVLDTVVERKTPADLAESIRDGRYKYVRSVITLLMLITGNRS